jgi:HPt (histidine-containing phosphotransfer) domain-containing protein
VHSNDTLCVLDHDQLRDVTMDDEELMRDIISSLIDDTSRQIALLDAAIRQGDRERCVRLAHYSKGACANVGANAAAAVLKHIERKASDGQFQECSASLRTLVQEIERLKSETVAI